MDHFAQALQADPAALAAAAQLIVEAGRADHPDSFLSEAVGGLLEPLGAKYVAAARLASDGCRAEADAGDGAPALPRELIAEALDRQETVEGSGWTVAPLAHRETPREVLAAWGGGPSERTTALASALGTALAAARRREADRRRIRRLETILEIAQQWNETQEMETLLEQMASASTRLLSADRASIFLWDRSGKTLIARPALGVDGEPLRIPDDTGIVGRVIHSGQPSRVGSGSTDEQIDRRVDKQLGYKTRNLVCVPLVSSRGRILGAFEVLNRKEGDFSEEDEAGLIELAAHAAVALEKTERWEQLLQTHRRVVDQAASSIQLIGTSPAIEALRSTIGRVADTDLAVLILGENGTGKEIVSRSIHYLSGRRDQPWVAVNCAALSETLLESELFGHEKGAFTDAHEARQGKFELASGGTLFLDEIGDLSLGGQAKLLRVLEERVVVRVGGSNPIPTDTRVVAATNQDLVEMVREKKFREDLYYRLNVVTLELPPLRERGDDIVLLAEHFLAEACQKARRPVPRITPEARQRLVGHRWQGNVRELRNLMERLAYLLPDDRPEPAVEADDLAFSLSPHSEAGSLMESGLPLSGATRQFQAEYIRHTIGQAGGNMSEAAHRLGLHRSNLYRKMRQLEMEEKP